MSGLTVGRWPGGFPVRRRVTLSSAFFAPAIAVPVAVPCSAVFGELPVLHLVGGAEMLP